MVPGFQSLMLPLLKLVSNKKEHKMRVIIEELANEFNLNNDEREEMISSGQLRFDNRVGWAKTYLKKAGLIENPERGIIRITERGLDVLNENPPDININYLKQLPEYKKFKEPKPDTQAPSDKTPYEIIDSAYQEIRNLLSIDLLTKVIELSPPFFEKLVIDLLVKMGYGGPTKDAGKTVGKSGDEGIDGTIKQDKLGLDIIYIQAKRWQPGINISRKEVQSFAGALEGKKAMKGVFITTSSFTDEAIKYVKEINKKIILIDGKELVSLMIDHDIGVTKSVSYDIKKIYSDYFSED